MRLYARSRHVGLAVVLVVLLALVSAASGERVLAVASGDRAVPSMPYRYVLGMFAAVVGVGSQASPVAQADRGDTGVLAAARSVHALCALVLGAGLMAGAETVTDVGEPAVAVRSYLGWFGLATASAALLRPSVAWLLPVLGMAVVTWFGYDDGAAVPTEWNWALARADSALSWIVAVLLLAGALAASWVRGRRLR